MTKTEYDDFYDKPTAAMATDNTHPEASAPPLPRHLETSRDSNDQYAMKEIPVNSPSPYPVYNAPNVPPQYNDPHHDLQRTSMSDMKFIDHYDSDDDLEKIIPREKKRRSCIDKTCCGCCTCCPKWMRWCSCIFLIIILILVIVVGILAALFKVPKIEYTGLKQDPVVTSENSVLSMVFDVGITVDNPNFEGLTFEIIKADAYYPSPYNVYIGGGNITNLEIKSNAITDITFPFAVRINSTDPAQQGVVMDLVTRCGLDGSATQNLDFDYYVYPTVRIIGIPITPKIKQSLSIPCPLKAADLSSFINSFLP
ncbi:hypothetical protein EDC94DRAFT_556593 [Helicostylum pulchrum]|uniref:Late embryogenesis abundant protein LEA-2 subgroup domain-containing protein n=1 Tax=Helicostylum pulchrum TaxID=562976 RepID=A0ABP9XRP3_9FUNG|nr:hypothetical protein EDC94DRAFT_556593 [Helicostylum pulchrum]